MASKNIWIVDDDQEMAAAVTLMLQMLSYSASHFLGARLAAKELLDGNRPDLLLLDISMPEVTGIMMLEFIRRRPEWNTIPIIMLSSEATETQVEEARKLGADDYVMKPVTLEELESAIQTVWQKYGKE
jgi:DNA-binding response OmpR family regulator